MCWIFLNCSTVFFSICNAQSGFLWMLTVQERVAYWTVSAWRGQDFTQDRRGGGLVWRGRGGGWTKMIWFVINCCHNKYNAFLFFFKVFNIYVYTLEENYNNSKKAKFELKSNTVSTSARVILLHNGREWSWFIHIFPTWLHVDQMKTKRHKHIYFNYYV